MFINTLFSRSEYSKRINFFKENIKLELNQILVQMHLDLVLGNLLNLIGK